MKTIIIISFILSSMSFASAAAKKINRKVSNSHYYTCHLERDYQDKNVFKKDYHFPFPTEKGEVYELKGSMRWNKFVLIFSQDGSVDISISERVKGEQVTATKTHILGKDPHFDSFKVQMDIKKDEVVIPYIVQCGPE